MRNNSPTTVNQLSERIKQVQTKKLLEINFPNLNLFLVKLCRQAKIIGTQSELDQINQIKTALPDTPLQPTFLSYKKKLKRVLLKKCC